MMSEESDDEYIDVEPELDLFLLNEGLSSEATLSALLSFLPIRGRRL
jgi:hypothetical protein